MIEDGHERYRSKLCTAAQAIGRILPGERIFIASGAAEPVGLVEALTVHGTHLRDNEIVHILTLGPAPYVAPELGARFRHTALFIGKNVRSAVQEGRADFVPVFLSEVPSLLRAGKLRVDVALLHVSPPDPAGYVSLGVSVDVVRAALESARLIIAQVNPHMPRSAGQSLVPVNKLDCLVELPQPLVELPAEAPDAVALRIGQLVAELVPDGATLQIGIGRLPNAVLEALHARHDLGIHTEMLSDGVMQLARAGVVTGKRKSLLPGKIVTSFVMGSRELYAWIDGNADVELYPSDFTNDPFVIAKNSRMVAINSALSIDLTGQVAADSVGGRLFSGIGGQVDFMRGAARSPGGKPIIALPATALAGKQSRIVSVLEPGAGVVTSRGDVHYVVTEYGVAQLWGKSVRERAAALLEIAHPDVRPDLLNEAKARHYLLPDHPLPNPAPPLPDRVVALRTGERTRIRQARVSDEDALQDFLYRLSDETTFLRFFGRARVHPRREVLNMVEVDPAASAAFVACSLDDDELLGIARVDRVPHSNQAELSLVVADTWQHRGLGGALLDTLCAAAGRQGFSALIARVLRDNWRMQRLLDTRGFACPDDTVGAELWLRPLHDEDR
jgi:acyl-CoA hydrolase/N-acetylglutamate synthase-like GNAT family acetyltransferase